MTAKVVGDLVTVRGLGFVGVDGTVVESPEEARTAIRSYLDNPDIGLILVGQTFADALGDEFKDYKLRKSFPLVLNIPDSYGGEGKMEDIAELVQSSLGIRL